MNLLIVSLDTFRFDALSCAPDRRLLGDQVDLARTPNLDRIASEGTLFARAVSACPRTSPSHASLFTGTYWPKHGVLDLLGFQMDPEAETLAGALRRRGYRTALNAGRGRRDGWSFETGRTGLDRGFELHQFGGWLKRPTRRWLADVGRREPWHLFFHTMAMHEPYGGSHRRFRRAARRDLDDGRPFRRLMRLYLRNVTGFDRRFGRLWKRLRKGGLLDQTLVVILSDHGEGLSVHGERHHDAVCWQEGVCRVPVIFWCPGLVRAGQVIEEAVSTVDVAPTVEQLLGMQWRPKEGFDGESLAPVVRGEQAAAALRGRSCYFFSCMPRGSQWPPLVQGFVRGSLKYTSSAPLRPEQWEEIEAKVNGRKRHPRNLWRKYSHEQLLKRRARDELELLFDTATDPAELHDLTESRPDALEDCRQTMRAWWADHHPRHAIDPPSTDEAEQRIIRKRLAQFGYAD